LESFDEPVAAKGTAANGDNSHSVTRADMALPCNSSSMRRMQMVTVGTPIECFRNCLKKKCGGFHPPHYDLRGNPFPGKIWDRDIRVQPKPDKRLTAIPSHWIPKPKVFGDIMYFV